MIFHGAAPGVKDSEKSRKIAPDVSVVTGQFLYSLRRCFEYGGICCPLVGANQAAGLLRDGKGDHEMMPWKLPVHLPFQPKACFMVLTGWTVPVAAGHVDDMGLAALLALIESYAGGFGATLDDGLHGLSLLTGHGRGKLVEILGAEGAKDFTDCCHSETPSWWNL